MQKLQSFHRAKQYRGSPMNAKQLMAENRNYVYDPRPATMRNNVEKECYQSHFRSVVLNYRGDGLDMPVKHLFPPANTYAITNDHDYVASPETYFLATSHVNIACRTGLLLFVVLLVTKGLGCCLLSVVLISPSGLKRY